MLDSLKTVVLPQHSDQKHSDREAEKWTALLQDEKAKQDLDLLR